MRKHISVVVVAFAALIAVNSQAQSPDPWIGTWKVNLEKSTFSPGPKPTVPGTVKVEPAGEGVKTTMDRMSPQGQPIHTETTGTFDGKDNPVTGAPTPNSTVAYKRIDGRSFEVTAKVDGKPTTTTTVVVSADGKTLTATQSGTNAQGESISNVIVHDKQ